MKNLNQSKTLESQPVTTDQDQPRAELRLQNRLIIAMSIIVACTVLVFTLVILFNNFRKITFDRISTENISDESAAGIQTISADKLKDLIESKHNFGLFVSQPNCVTATNLRKILLDLSEKHSVTFFEIPFSELRSSGLASAVRFYPSFIVYRDGEIVDFLDANDSADTAAYTTADGFYDWLTKYVRLEN